jgi:RimJ/RimL family protein N-acetyltransferase
VNDFDDATVLPAVRLRPAGEADAALLARLSEPEVCGEWDYFDDPQESMLDYTAFGAMTHIVEMPDGEAVGSVSQIQIPYGPNERSLTWSIGITILPDYRQRHIGAAAQRELALQLFASSDANRVQADTDIGNISEQRSLQHAGFSREGIARGAQWRCGAWHDRVIFAMLRNDATMRESN